LRLLAAIFFASVALGQAAESAAGRWEGSAQIPGGALQLIVDLAEESGQGWIGSIIIPSFGVKGAPLVDLHLRSSDLAFAIKGALGSERAARQKSGRILPWMAISPAISGKAETPRHSFWKKPDRRKWNSRHAARQSARNSKENGKASTN